MSCSPFRLRGLPSRGAKFRGVPRGSTGGSLNERCHFSDGEKCGALNVQTICHARPGLNRHDNCVILLPCVASHILLAASDGDGAAPPGSFRGLINPVNYYVFSSLSKE